MSATDHAESFPPIEGDTVRLLILGSLPGRASLDAQAYYAHPRNAFWPILMAMLTGESPSYSHAFDRAYADRCALLHAHGIAVWDVLSSGERRGSLDSAIRRDSEVPNDIAELIRRHPELVRIACNGRKAEALFRRHVVAPGLVPDDVHVVCLPSSSPAMARLSLDEKAVCWADLLAHD